MQLVVLSGWCSQWRAGVTGDVNLDGGVTSMALEAGSERFFGWGHLPNLEVLCSLSHWSLFHPTPIYSCTGLINRGRAAAVPVASP